MNWIRESGLPYGPDNTSPEIVWHLSRSLAVCTPKGTEVDELLCSRSIRRRGYMPGDERGWLYVSASAGAICWKCVEKLM